MIQNFVIESHELLIPPTLPLPALARIAQWKFKYSFATREQRTAISLIPVPVPVPESASDSVSRPCAVSCAET